MCLAWYTACFSLSSLCSVFMDFVLFMMLLYSFLYNAWFFLKHHRHPEAVWMERVFSQWASVLGGHSACTFKQYEHMPISSFKFGLSVLEYWGIQNKKDSMKNNAKDGRRGTSSLHRHTLEFQCLNQASFKPLSLLMLESFCRAGFMHLLALKSQELRVTDLGRPQMSFNSLM